MAILLSGDFHNNARGEIQYITKDCLLETYGVLYNEIKYHIILGDAGFLWPEYGEYKNKDKENFDILKERDFPILCVMGNHEPVYGRNDLEEIDIGIDEKVIVVNKKNPFVAYLKRGKIYNIDGYKILVLGGAKSVDKHRRKENESWWKNEYWSKNEKQEIKELIKKEKYFDFVFSHTGTDSIHQYFGMMGLPGRNEKSDDEVSKLNEYINKRINYRAWFFAHWHKDHIDQKHGLMDEDVERKRYFCIYTYTILLNKNKLTVFKEWGEEEI